MDPIAPSWPLNNGVEIPALGLGLYQAETGEETKTAVHYALECGYRHFDTASIYGNEGEVGEALRETRVPREELFITTKLWNDAHGYDQALKAFDESRARLGLDVIDLYLIHWPVPEQRIESWHALETLLQKGRCRAVGVSNFMIPHLEELLARTGVVPAVNQVEFSPFLYQRGLHEYCKSKGIRLEAYSPLTRGKKLDDPSLVEIAGIYHKTPAQILIRWALEHEIVVIPKSVRPLRIAENAAVFDVSIAPEQMARLDALDAGFRTCWDPTGKP